MSSDRLVQLRRLFPEYEIDSIIIGSPANRRYLSGFTGSAGWLIITGNYAFLAVDFRYVEQARHETSGFEICHVKDDFSLWFAKLFPEMQMARVGIESEHITHSFYQHLAQVLKQQDCKTQLVPIKNVVESLRIKKDRDELSHIKEACKIADQAIGYATITMNPGMTEKQVAWELESFIRQNGSGTLPFEIIVASGPNSALPHARPTERLIQPGEPITIDLGTRANGYCSDITRTFFIGKEDTNFNKIYNIVLAAQSTALSMIRPGVEASYIDSLARSIIDNAGYAELFGHGLGHGVGLETHESPRLGTRSTDILQEGMVFTVEPGIYIPGWGGIRIEDTVAIEGGNLVMLTNANKVARIKGG